MRGRGKLLVAISALAAIAGCRPINSAHEVESEMAISDPHDIKCLGFLDVEAWRAKSSDLAGFALVTRARGLDGPPASWRIEHLPWCTSPNEIAALVAAVRIEAAARGHLNIDPTRYLALRFGDNTFQLVELADIGPARNGVVIFVDGFAPVEQDLRLVIARAHGLKSFTIP
ncbi:MAG: hypothetical protein ACKVX7_16760 [Planctomycetota bacterium]